MLKCYPKIHSEKRNKSMFVERGSKAIVAAGKPSEHPYLYVADDLKHYPLKEVDALIHDDDDDDNSYWKKPSGTTRDLTLLPAGFDMRNAAFGRHHAVHEYGSDSAYGLICPKDTPIPKTSPLLDPGYQTDRHYFRPAYDPNQSFGMICRPDAKCCVTTDGMMLGTAFFTPRAALEADIKQSSTGNVHDSLPTCPILSCSGREFFLQCLTHLNTLRTCLSKICDDQFFTKFYMHLKYLDKTNTGWLPKDDVYNFCTAYNIGVNPYFIEPLLEIWNGFDGSQIQYRIFVDTINFTKPSADIPKIPDFAVNSYSTTYNDMVRPGQEVNRKPMAGFPSARYIDAEEVSTPAGMCKADHNCLPKESDVRSCISPSNFTLFGESHRDMYAKRSPEAVRELFEAAGENFTDKRFSILWDEAKKYHSLGWVCYATFRKALDNESVT